MSNFANNLQTLLKLLSFCFQLSVSLCFITPALSLFVYYNSLHYITIRVRPKSIRFMKVMKNNMGKTLSQILSPSGSFFVKKKIV